MFDTPGEHKWITKDEKKYIISEVDGTATKETITVSFCCPSKYCLLLLDVEAGVQQNREFRFDIVHILVC